MEYQTTETGEIKKVEVKKEPSTAAKVAVLVALIALLIVGILLPIKLVPSAFSTFGDKINSFFTSNSSILSVDTNTIKIGSPFTLKWAGNTNTNGTYVLNYDCAPGIALETSINQPHEIIPCGTSYYFPPQASNSITLTPHVNTPTIPQTATVPVTLSFIKNGDSTTTKIATQSLTINNASDIAQVPTQTYVAPTSTPVVTTTSTPTPTPTKTVIPTTSGTGQMSGTGIAHATGPADLSVVVLSTGYVNPATNLYSASQSVPAGMRASIRFEVKNIGGATSGMWSFTAQLPSTSHPTYTSYNQRSLNPGDYTIYTLGFDNLNEYRNNPFSITVNPNHTINESSYANNTASGTIING